MTQPNIKQRQLISIVNFFDNISSSDLEKLKFCNLLKNNINKRLKQFGLGYYWYDDVVSELSLRMLEAQEKRKTIHNYKGWIMLTSLRIIQEISRKQNKQSFKPDFNDIPFNSLESRPYSDEKQVKILNQALSKLKNSDKLILNLRVIEKLTCKQIKKELESRNIFLTEEAIRQRGNRAVKKLAKIYKEIENKQG